MLFKNNKRKKAFTLAEVLITLSIIGVIAAMTIPTLVMNYQKIITETRMKAFYSNMTQAVGQWLAGEHIEPKDVYFQNVTTTPQFITWWNNNIGKYLAASSVESVGKEGEDPHIRITMLDGSASDVFINNPGTVQNAMHFFWCTKPRFCDERIGNGVDGRRTFLFTLEPGNKNHAGAGRFQTSYYTRSHTKTRDQLLEECGKSSLTARYDCSRLIEIDGWKIKSDYPWF